MKEARIAISKVLINQAQTGLLDFEAQKLFNRLPNANQIVLIAQDWTEETTEDKEMTLRDANLQPGDKLELRRTGLTVKYVDDIHVTMDNNIPYGIDKEYFNAENVVRAPVYPEFWPPKPGDVWSHDGYEYFCFNNGMLTSIYNLISYKPEDFIGENEVELKYRPGMTDKDSEATTQRVISLSKQVVEQKDKIRCLKDEIEELEIENADLQDDVIVAQRVAKDARKDAYLKELQEAGQGWEFKFTYVPGTSRMHDNESAWCGVVETEIDWTEQMERGGCTIQKVSFRKAKS